MKRLMLFGFAVLTLYVDGVFSRECILDVAFLLDGSGNVRMKNWYMMLQFVQTFERQVNFGKMETRIGVISYGREATMNIELNKYDKPTAFEQAVANIPFKGEKTNAAIGLRALRTLMFVKSNGDRPDVPNVAILLTDTASQHNVKEAMSEADKAKARGITIFAIAMGLKAKATQVGSVASDPVRLHVSAVTRFSDLSKIVDLIVNSSCILETAKQLWSCSFEENEPQKQGIQYVPSPGVFWRIKLADIHDQQGPEKAYDGKYYMFLDSANLKQKRGKAIFYLPFNKDGVFCLSFYYHMYGFNIGNLELFVLSNKHETVLRRVNGQEVHKWLYTETLVRLQNGDRIGFRGIRNNGVSGDVAVDQIRIRKGVCFNKI